MKRLPTSRGTSVARFGVAALMATALWSCDDRAVIGTDSHGNCTIEAQLVNPAADSRTAVDPSTYLGGEVGLLWLPTDSLGVFGDRGSANVSFTNDESTQRLGNTTFSGTLSTGESPRYAYYPYSAAAGTDPASLRGTLPSQQPFSMTGGEIVGDYKIGVNNATSVHSFTFSHIFSMLKISIDATGTAIEGETLEAIRFSSSTRRLCGDFTFSAIDGTYSFNDGSTGGSEIEMTWTDRPALESGRQYVGYISCAPELRSGDKMNIVVLTSEHSASFSFDVTTDMLANAVYTMPLELRLKEDLVIRTLPTITSLSFSAADNAGKILDHEVVNTSGKPGETTVRNTSGTVTLEKRSDSSFYGYIPYLNNRTLVPVFTVPEGVKVYSGETEVVSGKTAVDFRANPVLRAVSSDGTGRDITVTLENTGLPVVVINHGSPAPTKAFLDINVRGKDEEWVTTDVVSIYNADGTVDVDSKAAGVRLRGNTTQGFDKKPFAIKFVKKQSVLGMPKHKRWVLLALRIDRSLLRNSVAFRTAHVMQSVNGGEGMLWNPHGQNVELVVDGRHVGNYYLCEQIKIGSDRLAINDNYEDRQSDGLSTGIHDCGYLLEIDYHYDETYKFHSAKRGLPVMFKDDLLGDENMQWVRDRFNQVESYLAAGNYTEAYKLIDINSIIDHWLVYEIAMNNEYGNPGSVYYWINGSGGSVAGDEKFHAGPVWDFDWATFHNPANRIAYGDYYARVEQPDYTRFLCEAYNQTPNASTGKKMYIWIPQLLKDAAFRTRVQERWSEIYPALSSQIPDFIRRQGELISRSFDINDGMWPAPYSEAIYSGNDRVYNGDEKISGGYSAVTENLVSCYLNRLQWLNTAITSGNFPTDGK